jgi:outer membrane receptor for ferrienterochelin and colicin
MARYLLLFFSLLFMGGVATAQTSLAGKVTEEDTGEPAFNTTVKLHKNGNFIGGTITDFDGNYSFSNIDPGTYEVEFSYVGFSTQRIADVRVLAGKAIKLDAKLSKGINLDEVVVIGYKAPLIEQDNTTQGRVITGEDIKNLPTRNINALASTAAGLSSSDEGEALAIRGSRTDATQYYVDGMRVQGSLVPESEIDQLQVITGGVAAEYGDVTGGIISITTKGPSSKFNGGVEAETSQFLDAYNNNLIGLNMSGPLLKNKEGGSIIGFRLSGRYTYNEDDDAPAVPIYRINDEKLAEIEANPVVNIGGDPFVAADFLTNDDVNILDAQPFEDATRYDITAKLDARLSDAIDVTLTGVYSDRENQFTPNGGNGTGANWRLLNSHNNPINSSQTYRGNFRFRHRLGGAGADDEGKNALIQNVSYTLQAGYENNINELTDPRHGFNYFDYGFVGQLKHEWVPAFTLNREFDPITGELINSIPVNVGYQQVLREYVPGAANPILSNYNNFLGIPTGEGLNANIDTYVADGQIGESSRTDFAVYNGTISSNFTDSWGFHNNVGTVYNLARKSDNDIYTFNANAAFDLVPGGSEKGRHNIQIGIAWEQRTNRSYSVNPRNLWGIARQLVNANISGVPIVDGLPSMDADTVGYMDGVVLSGVTYDQVPLIGVTTTEGEDLLFHTRLRAALGLSASDYVDLDGLTPDQLSLDMFSAKELNDQGVLGYYGYDYLGNEYDGKFDDFFTSVDENGIRTFPVAPASPIYTAAFIQDKFTFKDVIFRLGVRVDSYDANTKVLKDKYSLYEIMGAGEFDGIFETQRPGNIGEDFKVYTGEGDDVLAYRDGDDWYRANGEPVNNSTLIFSSQVNPKYKDPRVEDIPNFIKSRDFDTSVSFEDYEAQVNVMPRLAFSFPISDKANFFAHYDVLVQRPPSNSIASPRDYFYFTDESSIIKGNPNLKPEKTVDYEVGFQQKLSNTSALKISAYYKEMRDMITFRTIFPVPFINSYDTYDNLDFGTVKGFSFQYDLRRTGNVTLLANYTLQFADGTGSNANSSRGIANNGVIRTLAPLSFDERHRFVASLDYRYRSGAAYNGPELFGAQIFANAGLNLQFNTVSGRPYTKYLTPGELTGSQISGAISGARKPWNSTLNLRIDKSFTIAKSYRINVYLRVSNVLDKRNIINVYPATGAPDDDGFLASANGISKLNEIENSKREVQAYLSSYQWRILNPNYFSLPRRMFIGASFSF